MSLKKAQNAVKTVRPQDTKLFYTWDADDKKGRAYAMYHAGKAVQRSEPVLRAKGTDIFRNILPGGISVRDGYDRWDYDNLRSTEAIPILPKHIIRKSLEVYNSIGIVRNVIDLMADFCTQGIELYHPNERIQRFYREWFRRVNGKERSERFCNLLYRLGNVILKRQTAFIPAQVEDEMRRAKGKSKKPDEDADQLPQLGKREIPWRYTFLNPIVVEVLAEELALFVGQFSFVFAIEIPRSLAKKIAHPVTPIEKKLISQLPKDVQRGVMEGNRYIPLDSDKVRAFYYKRDDWETWAKPMVYSILPDLQLLQKMKLADLSALDGAISSIRVWKLGNIEARILPTEAAINRLSEMLMNNVGGGVMDLVWGPEIDLVETKTDVHHFLGQTKYEPCLTQIYAGLGIPPTLTGANDKGGFTNNFISLKTLTERLDYGREQLVSFWNEEIRLVQKAMGFRFPARVVFDRMTLSDEASEKQLLINLWDRGLVSDECIMERFGETAVIEEARIRRDERKRRDGMKPPKASPFHDPQQDYGLKKIFAQTGAVSPSEVGVELDDKKRGEQSVLDHQANQQQQQLEHQQKMAEHQQKQTKLDMQKTEQDNDHDLRTQKLQLKHGVHPGQLQQQAIKTGVSGQGRPKLSKDSKKRKKKVVKPRTAASFFQTMAWAENAQAAINQIAGTPFLRAKGKKTMRELTNEEAHVFEQYKFYVLCNLEPNQTVDKETVGKLSAANLTIPEPVDRLLKATVAKYVESTGKEPPLEVLRRFQVGVYSLWKVQLDGEQASAGQQPNKVIDVPDIRQKDHYSCGACAAMSVGKYFGVGPDTLPEWKKALGTDVEHSTPPPHIVQYLSSLGLQVEARQGMTLDDLTSAVAQGKPVIVCVQDYGKFIPEKASFDYGHYLTVIGMIDDYVVCQDSSEDNVTRGDQTIAAPGRVLIHNETFLKNWHDKDEAGNKYIRFGIVVGK